MSAPELQKELTRAQKAIMAARVEGMMIKRNIEQALRIVEHVDTAQSSVPELRAAMIALVSANDDLDKTVIQLNSSNHEIETYKQKL